MKFTSRYLLAEHIGDVLEKEMGKEVEDISTESNSSTGRCDLIVEFKDGDTATLSITMTDKDGNSK